MRPIVHILLLLLAVSFSATPASAYDDTSFESDVAEAYASFRAAASYLRTDNASIGGLELAEADAKWRTIVRKTADAPPPAYAADDAFAADLNEVTEILGEGLDLVDAGETRKAYDRLLAVRGILHDLRGRNDRRIYADCVTELNLIMSEIIPFRRTPPDFADADSKSNAAILFTDYRAKLTECEGMAPKAYHTNEEFQRLYRLTGISADQSRVAVEQEKPGELFRMLGEIISFDRIIFFRFGS